MIDFHSHFPRSTWNHFPTMKIMFKIRAANYVKRKHWERLSTEETQEGKKMRLTWCKLHNFNLWKIDRKTDTKLYQKMLTWWWWASCVGMSKECQERFIKMPGIISSQPDAFVYKSHQNTNPIMNCMHMDLSHFVKHEIIYSARAKEWTAWQ